MHALRKQRTIARAATVMGFGFWSGRDVQVEFRPADEDTGIVFVRRDLTGAPRIGAVVANRIETPRRTTLSHRGHSVEMVEHVLAALAGLQVDNCEVWVDESEMPGCDGSSLPFVTALDTAGVCEQSSPRPRLIVKNVTRLGQRRQLGRGSLEPQRRIVAEISPGLRERKRDRSSDTATADHVRVVSPRAGSGPHLCAARRSGLAGIAGPGQTRDVSKRAGLR